MLMLIIFANIISRPIGDRLIKSKGGRFGFFSLNMSLFKIKVQESTTKNWISFHVRFTTSFLSLAIFTSIDSNINLNSRFIIN